MAERSFLRLQSELENWYEAQRRLGRDVTEVQHLERSMFGTYAKQTFSLKAAETNYYIESLIALIDKVSPRLDERRFIWRRLCVTMLACINMIRNNPVRLSSAQIQDHGC